MTAEYTTDIHDLSVGYRTCARCGRHIPSDDAWGFINDLYFCHPDDSTLPDCYHMATASTSSLTVKLSKAQYDAISRLIGELKAATASTIDSRHAGGPLEAPQTVEGSHSAPTPQKGPQ